MTIEQAYYILKNRDKHTDYEITQAIDRLLEYVKPDLHNDL